MKRPTRTVTLTAALAAAAFTALPAMSSAASPSGHSAAAGGGRAQTATPIKHVVVIFEENVSFDHYFGTYPNATNTSGPAVLRRRRARRRSTGSPQPLLTANPNGANPRRLDPANINDLLTCDQDHDYTAEQIAFDNGAMDKFVAGDRRPAPGTSPTGQPCQASDVMNYYDGNTVTGLWNYAQHFAMSDNSFGTTFGPSTPGRDQPASRATPAASTRAHPRARRTDGDTVADGTGGYTLISDAQPYCDDCSTRDAVAMTGHRTSATSSTPPA